MLLKKTFSFLLALFMIVAGVAHFVNPETYNPFIPDFLPELAVNYITGTVEIALGIGLLIPAFHKMAALGIFLLMCAFLPLHIIDVFIENPAIGSKTMAYIRLPIQFVFMAWPFWIWKSKK